MQPESKSRRIVIDQIRELEHAIQRKPLLASSKVAIIHDAERMQPQAANAFLKTLEEPPPGSLILLLSTVPEAILETVLSRCVETALRPDAKQESTPEEEAILSALKECLITKRGQASRRHSGWHELFRRFCGDSRKDRVRTRRSAPQGDARYKQASDNSSWFEERAGKLRRWWKLELCANARVLRDLRGGRCRLASTTWSSRRRSGCRCSISKVLGKELLRCLDTLELLRRRLALGVQETLAFESGFLEMITVHESSHSATQALRLSD